MAASALVNALPFPMSELGWDKLPAVVTASGLDFDNAVMVMRLVLGDPPEDIAPWRIKIYVVKL